MPRHRQVQSSVVDTLLAKGAAAAAAKSQPQLWPHGDDCSSGGRRNGAASAASAARTPTSIGYAGTGAYGSDSSSETSSSSEDTELSRHSGLRSEAASTKHRESSTRAPSAAGLLELQPVVPGGSTGK